MNPAVPARPGFFARAKKEMLDTAVELKADLPGVFRYLLDAEAHVHAFSIAANVLLSFFPFMLVMIALCRHLLHWPEAEVALYVAIRDFFPGETGRFMAYNLKVAAGWTRNLEWASVLLLLFTANGVFLPLEVALNRAWEVKANRSLWMNQAVSMGLIFSCGALALLSAVLTGGGHLIWSSITGTDSETLRMALTDDRVIHWTPMPLTILFKVASIPVTVIILFLVFWLLPNAKVPWRALVPRVVMIGLLLEILKWVNLAIWPWVYAKFSREFGPFRNSVTILTWSFVAALVVLAGADWTARRVKRSMESLPAPPQGD